MECPKCGYVMEPLDTECKRCEGMGVQAQSQQQQSQQGHPQVSSAPRRGDRETAAVSDTLPWVAAFSPLVYFPLFGVLLALGLSDAVADWVAFGIWVVVNGVLVTLDAKQMEAAGYDTTTMGNTWLMHQYLHRRAAAVERTNAYAVVWIVCFVVMLFGFLGFLNLANILLRLRAAAAHL